MISAVKSDSGCKLIDREFDRYFGAPGEDPADQIGARLSPEARLHLEQCGRCRQLYEFLSAEVSLEIGDVGPSEVYSKIRTKLQGTLTPVSPLPSTAMLAIQLLAVFVLFALPIGAILGFSGIHQMGPMQLIGVTLVMAAGAAALAYSLACQMRPGSVRRFSVALAIAVLAAGFIAAVGTLFPWQRSEQFIPQGWPCAVTGTVVAIPGSLIFWLLVRRGAPLSLTTLGGTLGAIAGLVGVAALQFSCSRQEATHLLVWHGSVLLLSTVVGILAGGAIKNSITRRA